MTQDVQVGTVLTTKDWPEMVSLLGPRIEPFLANGNIGNWSVINGLDGFALDRKVHAANWNFFFMAARVQGTVLGRLGTNNVRKALKRILSKLRDENFNCLEVTGIVVRSFLGVSHTTVSAHSRHIQQDWQLTDASQRQTSQRDATWAKG